MSAQSLIDYVEACLVAWAEWNRDGGGIGYASGTLLHRIMREGAILVPSTAQFDMPDPIHQTDLAIKALPDREQEAVRLKYLNTHLTDQQRADKMKVSRATFQNMVERAKWFIRGRIG